MDSLPPHDFHKEVEMKSFKTSLSYVLRGYHPSYFMAVFMLLVAGAMEISQVLQSASVAALTTTSLSRLAQFTVTYVFIKYMLMVFAAAIFVFKPTPAWSFGLSFPLIIYGGYAFRYLVEAGLPDLSIPALMIGGYLATVLLSLVSSLLVTSEQERIDCVSQYELLIKEYERTNQALKSSLEANRAGHLEPIEPTR